MGEKLGRNAKTNPKPLGLYFSIFFCGCKQPKSIHIFKIGCKGTNFF